MRARLKRFPVVALACLALLSITSCGNIPFDNVFMGDSITALWTSAPGANRGVPGNTTAKMLARFPRDILGHGFHTFILLGGTNDIRYNMPIDKAIENIATMAAEARTAGMNVVLCEIIPIYAYDFTLDPKVRALNAMIRQLAEDQHYYLVDYYDAMIGHPEYLKDQLHPSALGYEVMDRVLTPVLEEIPADKR